jgi:hypothetical protein
MSDTQPNALRLADDLQSAVQTYPQISQDEPGGYCRQEDQLMDEAAAELRRQHALNTDLLEACQTFAEWLRREDAGFDHKTHNRETSEGEAAWREWFYGNIAICGLAQDQVRAAIAKATGGEA